MHSLTALLPLLLQDPLPPAPPAAPPAPRTLLLAGALVHTGERGSEPSRADVLVVGERIEAVGPELVPPEGAERIDCTGLHLIPGLVDGLAHHDPDQDLLYLAAGITLLRDRGNERTRIYAERLPDRRARTPGPDLFVCGAILDGPQPGSPEALSIADELKAAELLPHVLEDQPDYLSTAIGLPIGAWRRALRTAHENGLALWGELPKGLELEDALSAKLDGLYGLRGFLFAGDKYAALERVDKRVARAAEEHLAVTPLLNYTSLELRDWVQEPEVLDWMSAIYLPSWRARLKEIRSRSVATKEALAREYTQSSALLSALAEAGVRLVPGSGAPHPLLAPGTGLLDELDLWVAVGIPPEQVLWCATTGATEALGLAQVRGRIAVGQIADAVLLAADPRQGLATLRRPAGLLVRGRWLSREELDLRLDELRQRMREAREALARPLEIAAPDLPEGALMLDGEYEQRLAGVRIAGERLAVVQEKDGALSFGTRVHYPATAGQPAREVSLGLRYRDNTLEHFLLVVRGGGHETSVDLVRHGGQQQIERRLDGAFLDNTQLEREVGLVDIGSALTEILISRYWKEGSARLIAFHGNDPSIVEWRMMFDPTTHELTVKTDQERLIAGMGEEGAPLYSNRSSPTGTIELVRLRVSTFGGPGLALPPERVLVPPRPDPAKQEPGTGPVEPEGGGGRH